MQFLWVFLSGVLRGFDGVPVATAQVVVAGSGTTNPSKFFWQIMEMFQARSHMDLQLSYRAVGSGTGQKEFSQASDGDYSASLTHFGAGDIPMSADHYSGITGAGRTMVHVPFCLGAIGIFHSIPAAEVGADGLKLSACVLAKIFSGQITTWDHADIIAENPNLNVPAATQIQVGHRARGSSSTGGLTGYINAKCPADWTMVNSGVAMEVGSSITWPTLSNFNEVEGSGGMKSFIASTPYAVGYLDAGHGHSAGFSEAMLMNEDSNWLTSTMAIAAEDANGNNGIAAAGASAVLPSDVTADWSSVNLYSQAGPHTWPIVLVSYIYLDADMSSLGTDVVGLIGAFVEFVTTDGQDMLADYSFNRIPAAMNQWAATWTNVIVKPAGVTSFTFETSTDPWNGQADTVISSKRNSYSLWKIGELADAMEAAEARISALETSLNDYGIVPCHGSGTTNPKNWFAKVMKRMEQRARVPLLLTYRAVGSSTGQAEFVGTSSNNYVSYNHFGAGDIPMKRANYDLLMARSPPETMVHLPFALGAIAVFHSVPTSQIGSSSLQLNACILARIFSGDITAWDHPDIIAQNPGLSVPAGTTIQVGHRTSGSSSTKGLSGYFTLKCTTSEWPLGDSSSLVWPTTAGFNPVQGSPGMQAHLEGVPYAIGYLDAGHGHDVGLSEVALTNNAGQTRTSYESIQLGGVADAGTQAINNNIFPSDPTADWSAVSLLDMDGANTWPIVLVSYLYVKQDQTGTNPKTAAALQAFIDYVLNNRDDLCATYGFTPPSSSLRTQSLNAAATIVFPPGMTSFVFEEDTTAYDGMAENVLSVKRHDADEYELDILQGQVADLQTSPAPTPASSPSPSDDDDDDGDFAIFAFISIIVAIIAIIVSSIAMFCTCKLQKEVKAAASKIPATSGTLMGHSREQC